MERLIIKPGMVSIRVGAFGILQLPLELTDLDSEKTELYKRNLGQLLASIVETVTIAFISDPLALKVRLFDFDKLLEVDQHTKSTIPVEKHLVSMGNDLLAMANVAKEAGDVHAFEAYMNAKKILMHYHSLLFHEEYRAEAIALTKSKGEENE